MRRTLHTVALVAATVIGVTQYRAGHVAWAIACGVAVLSGVVQRVIRRDFIRASRDRTGTLRKS
jgi:NhaP-type Na+/H+ or K+/H+ antiporter